MFNLTVQYLGKYNSSAQHLAYRGWHRRKRARVTTKGRRGRGTVELKDCRPPWEMEGKLRSLTLGVDGTGSGSLLDSILSTLLKK